MPSSPKLFLIDGYALIYRAFFAMIGRPLTTGKGENTSAAWGVANFLIRLLEKHRPAYVAWVHDAGTSFRHEVFPEYKATREKLEPELQEDFDRSVERIEALLEAFRVPLVEVEGYEADDVIGTLADRAVRAGLEAVIVSGDKDFYQLINDHIVLLNPGRGGPAAVDEQLVDRTNAADRLGVPPERVVDYLALVGDSSDNIPGVKGIGDKTARALVEEYGDLDSILAHAEDVKARRAREALISQREAALLSRDLVTIHRDVPVEIDVESLRAQSPDREALVRLFTELEFHSLLPRIQAGLDETAEAPSTRRGSEQSGETRFRLVQDPGEIPDIVKAARAARLVAVDVEATDLDPLRAQLVGFSIAVDTERAWYFPLGHRAPPELGAEDPVNLPAIDNPALEPLVRLLGDAEVPTAGHNIKYDWLVLRRAGVELRGVSYDSMLAAFLLEPSRRSNALDVLALERLGVQMTTYADLVGKGKNERPFREVAPEDAARYCCADAAMVLALRDNLDGELEATRLDRLLAEIEVPLIPVLVELEWTGIRLDTERLASLSREFAGELEGLERAIYKEAGTEFNINSTPQLRHVLFEKLNLPVIKKTKTGPSTDADVLDQLGALGFAVPALLLEYRELAKLRSTYVDALPQRVNRETGRIHTSFNQVGAATGRLSSSDPNLQNIPIRTARGERIRECFVPAEGWHLVAADYSQVELRILAHLSRDPAFISAFERGGDIHRETAAIIFSVPPEEVTGEMRARAKTINFGTIYGQGPFALSRQLNITQDEARDFIDTYFVRFAGVRRFLDETVELARKQGYVETLFGRRRYIPELKDRNHNMRAFGERTAMNSPLQGSAADLIKIAMVRVFRSLRDARLEARLLLQVHDELVLESPPDEVDRVVGIVRREMEGAAALEVPLVVDVGTGSNWLEAKK